MKTCILIWSVSIVSLCNAQTPVAGFEFSSDSICEGGSIQFIDTSLNNPITWEWHFQGGSPGISFLSNPIISYDTPGIFSVILIASNAFGSDTLQLNNLIVVNPSPQFFIEPANDTTICEGESVTLGISSSEVFSVIWIPALGFSSTVGPAATTTFIATGVNEFGCEASDTIIIYVEVCSGISQANEIIPFFVFSNPANDYVLLQTSTPGTLTVSNSVGQILRTFGVVTGEIQVSTLSWPPDIYILTFHTGKIIQTKKLLIQH